jgi:hypothetical protein
MKSMAQIMLTPYSRYLSTVGYQQLFGMNRNAIALSFVNFLLIGIRSSHESKKLKGTWDKITARNVPQKIPDTGKY